MGVIFRFHRQTVVENVGNRGHVDTACGYIGRHQNLYLTIAQRHQTAVTQTLAQRTVQRNGVETFLLQIACQTVAFDLRAGKHNRLVNGRITQPVVEQLAFVVRVVRPEQCLFDVGVFFLGRVDGHAAGFAHHACCQLLNAGRKRRAEHHGLFARDGELVDFRQIIGKTQIQHTVGFVNDQELHLVEFNLHGALQIQQTSGRGDDQISVLQLGDLQLIRHTADDIGNTQTTAMAHEVDGIVRHLLRQFARRANDQSTRGRRFEIAGIGWVFAAGAFGQRFTACFGFGDLAFKFGAFGDLDSGLLLQQSVQNGQQKGGGFAATGLAGNHQINELIRIVFVGQCQRNGFGLYGRGLGVAQIAHGVNQFGGQSEFDKTIGRCIVRLVVFRISGIFNGQRSVNGRRNARSVESFGHDFPKTQARQAMQAANVNG